MSAIPITVPFEVFYDNQGNLLDSGYIYIGQQNLNPITNPISIYWDEELTIPAVQPLRTSQGYVYRNGTPANVYASEVYSILIQDRNRVFLYSNLSPDFPITGDALPWLDASDYGTAKNNTTISAALAQGESIYGAGIRYTLLLRKCTWTISDNLTFPDNVQVYFENGAVLAIASGKTVTYECTSIMAPDAQIISGSGEFIFFNKIARANILWWGAVGDYTSDNTIPLQAALKSCSENRTPMYVPSGVFMYSDSLVARSGPGGITIFGDGYNSVLYQVGSGKNCLEIGKAASGSPTIMEGLNIHDLSIVGTTGTNYGLYLEEVARSNFANLWICADQADLAVKGCLINSWTGIKLSYATFNENPITGIVIPTNRRYGLYTVTGSSNSYTTNAFNGLVVEGHSVGGIFVDGGSTNTYSNLVIEGELGYGMLSSAEWDIFNGVYFEGITGAALEFRNTQKFTVNSLFTNTERIVLNNAFGTFMNCRAIFELGLTPSGTTFINCDGSISYADNQSGTYSRFINCAFNDTTHDIDLYPGDGMSGGITNSFATTSGPRALKTSIQYGLARPTSGRWSWGDKVYFSDGNINGNRGPATGGYMGSVCINRADTTLSSATLAGATALPVASTSGMAVGDVIGVQITGTTYEYSIITSFSGGPVINVSPAITSAALISAKVVTQRWALFSEITGFQTLNVAAGNPTVLGGRNFITSGAGTITDFTNGVSGQEVRIFADHTVTITDGTNIFLSGSANFVMGATDSLTVIQKPNGKWYEVCRSVN